MGSNEAKFLKGRQKISGIGSELKIAGWSVCLSFKACGSVSFPFLSCLFWESPSVHCSTQRLVTQ